MGRSTAAGLAMVAWALCASCGNEDDAGPSDAMAVDGLEPDAELWHCRPPQCIKVPPAPDDPRISEAIADLEYIGERLVARYNVERRFVTTAQSSTPTASCCTQNHNNQGMCAPTVADWRGNATWDAIPFQKKFPHAYQYSYVGVAGGAAAVATATGNLDCDGMSSTISLWCDVRQGTPRCRIRLPTNED